MNNYPKRDHSRKLERPKKSQESRFARITLGCRSMEIGHMNANLQGDTL